MTDLFVDSEVLSADARDSSFDAVIAVFAEIFRVVPPVGAAA